MKTDLSPDFVKVFTAKPDTKHLGKVFHEKCKLGYDMLLANRADIRIRFALLLDANIPELRHKDIVYLGSCLTVPTDIYKIGLFEKIRSETKKRWYIRIL